MGGRGQHNQEAGKYYQQVGNVPPLPGTIPEAMPPSSITPAADHVDGIENGSAIRELRSEVSALRRELRLLRIANSELERVAVRDTLTPLFNRRYFLTALQDHLARTRRYGSKAALLFIDVNRMKYINDHFGHNAGDHALLHIAHIVEAHIRAGDIAARIGGDEFAMILECVDEQGAISKTEQLTSMLRATPCMFGTALLPVSASVGFTLLHPDDTSESLMDRADANMYAHKRKWYGQQSRQTLGGDDTPHKSAVA